MVQLQKDEIVMFEEEEEESDFDEAIKLRTFRRKDGTMIFTKNDNPSNMHKKRHRKAMLKQMDDNQEIELNLYKDLDLDNGFNFEEAEAEEEGEFVITLQRKE